MPQQLKNDLVTIEIKPLLEAIYRHYGFDFRDYALSSLKRRILGAVRDEKLNSISGLQEKVLRDRTCMERLLLALSVNATSIFRDPGFFLTFREQIVPMLRTYPFVRIWHAGCATGEEAYSMAILLQEEGLYDRCRLYATDMDEAVLEKAEAGVFPLVSMQEYTDNYQRAGGKVSFSEYYTAKFGNAILRKSLKKNITFAQHNLVTDSSFNEFNVILCRNVLIYFNKSLQNRVHDLLHGSLIMFGILGLGLKESLRFSSHEQDYEVLDAGQKLYRRTR